MNSVYLGISLIFDLVVVGHVVASIVMGLVITISKITVWDLYLKKLLT